ncbi:MAG: hypothetical protein ABL921_04735 [Pirellula sp.]
MNNLPVFTAMNEERTSKGCLFYCLLAMLIGPFALGLAMVGAWFVRESVASSRLAARVAVLKANGLPVDDATMKSYYDARTDPSDSNAWNNIFATISSPEFTQASAKMPYLGNVPDVPGNGEWENETEVRGFLHDWKQLHDQVTSLTKNAHVVRFPIQFDSVNTLLPHVQQSRTVARLIKLYGQVALRDRDSKRIREAVEALMEVSWLANEHLLISDLVKMAIDSMSIGLLKQALEQDAIETADLEKLLPLIQSSKDVSAASWKAMFVAERGIALPAYKKMPMGRSSDANYYLDMVESYMEVPTDGIDKFRTEVKKREAMFLNKANASWLSQMDSVVTQLAASNLSSVAEAFVRVAVEHRIATLAIGIRLFEDKHGKLPMSLAELSEFSIDSRDLLPVGKKPFGYRVQNDGAILWGFELKENEITPDEPPILSSEPTDTIDNRWIWSLKSIR